MPTRPGSVGSDNDTIASGNGSRSGVSSVVDPPPKPPVGELGHGGNNILPWMDIADVNEEVPELAWPASINVYDRMRRDSQIASILRAVFLPIRRYRWRIDPNGARDEIVAHIAADMGLPIHGDSEDEAPQGRVRGRFDHDFHLRHALLSTVFGHMFMEQVGDIGTDGLFHLRKLAPRMPGTIMKIKVARDGGLTSIVQFPSGHYAQTGGALDDPSGIEIPVERLVAYVHEREGGNWVGRSVLRDIYCNWLIKDRLLRVDAIKHERNGMGVPTFEGPPGATKAQMDEGREIATRWMAGDMSGAALPNGARIRLVGVEGLIPDTIASVRYHDQQMARIFLEMFMDLGTTQSGARALAETFIDFFDMAQEAIADDYANVTTGHVIEDIVDWNWGEDEQAPRLMYEKAEDKNLAVADLVELVTSGALTVDDDTERWLRERWQIPELTTERPPKVVPPPPAPAPVPGEETTNQPQASDRPGLLRRVARRVRGAVEPPVPPTPPTRKLRREPTTVEAAARVDFARIEEQFTTELEAALAAWASVQIDQMDELGDAIAEAVDAEDWAALADLSPSTMGIDVLRDRMLALANAAAVTATAELAGQGKAVTLPTIDKKQIEGRATAFAGQLSAALTEVMSRKAMLYAGPGMTGADVALAVKEYVASLTDTYIRDRMTGALMSAQNDGRMAVWDKIGEGAARYYASELLDQATCDECEAIDGTQYDTLDDAGSDYPSGGYVDCAGGDRCRGTLVAVAETEQEATVA